LLLRRPVPRAPLTQKHFLSIGVVEADGRRISAIVDACPAIEIAASERELIAGNLTEPLTPDASI
jgi:hypothetical protein